MNFGRLVRIGIIAVTAVAIYFIGYLSADLSSVPEGFTQYKAYFNEAESNFSYGLRSYFWDKYGFVDTDDPNGSIIFSSNFNYDPGDGYVGYDLAFSPIVAMYPINMLRDDDNNNFNIERIPGSSNYYNYSTDMEKVIEAFINSDTGVISLTDLGYKNGPKELKIGIPDNGSGYRRHVINALIYLISKGSPITEDNAVEVKEKLDILLKNSVSINNPINESLHNEGYIIFLPEYVVKSIGEAPVYWNNSYSINMRMFIPNTIENGDELVSIIKSNQHLLKRTKFRSELDQKVGDFQYGIPKRVSQTKYSEDLAGYFGDNYWK